MKTSKILLAILAATVLGGLGAANATQINGTVGFTSAANTTGGTFVPDGSGGGTVIFNNPLHVNFGTDDYSTVPVGTAATFSNITFDSAGHLVGGGNIPEWTFTVGATAYSFDLLSLQSASFHSGNPNALALMGQGTAHITGFDDTFATFALQGTGKGFTFTILQASNTAVPNVPEGGSGLALLGLGLIAVEGLRRKLALT
jgi:hypothetical protein